MENNLELLEKFLKSAESKINKDRYLLMMAQRGEEPDPKKIPIDYDDLSLDCRIVLNIYNRLGNRVYSDVGFIGKDYTNLPILIESYGITNKEYLLDLLNIVDTYNIEKSQKAIKKMYDDLKKKKS
jgi:hypothetical protein